MQSIGVKGSDLAARIAALDKSATYAVYCRSGKRSGMAPAQMFTTDFTDVHDLTGGIGAWPTMGGAVVTGGS